MPSLPVRRLPELSVRPQGPGGASSGASGVCLDLPGTAGSGGGFPILQTTAHVNIEVQTVSATRKALVVAFDASEVDAEHKLVVQEFSGQVRLPGFRPGKAPAQVVAKRFAKEIDGELVSKLVNKAYREAVAKESLRVLGVVTSDAGTVSAGKPATVRIEVDLQPEFELPAYEGISVRVPESAVSEAEIDRMIEALRRERADFSVVERPAAAGDYVRIKYSGTMDGRPLSEFVGERLVFAQMEQTWEEAGTAESLIPGFGAGIVGLAKGDRKSIEVAFPESFAVESLRSKTAVYEVEALEIRERKLPELDAEFLKNEGAETIEEFRKEISGRISQAKENEARRSKRQQVSAAIANAIQTEIPEALVERETQSMLYQFMQENLRRGVAHAEFEKRKEDLHAAARSAAVERLKVQFALGRIAEKEKITVTNQDIGYVLHAEARRAGVAVEKYAKDLAKDRDRVTSLQHGILLDKALEFVVSKANVTVEAPQPAAAGQ